MNIKRSKYEFPVLKDVVVELKINEDDINKKFYKMLENSQENMPASFITKDWDELSEKLSLSFEKILNKKCTRRSKAGIR